VSTAPARPRSGNTPARDRAARVATDRCDAVSRPRSCSPSLCDKSRRHRRTHRGLGRRRPRRPHRLRRSALVTLVLIAGRCHRGGPRDPRFAALKRGVREGRGCRRAVVDLAKSSEEREGANRQRGRLRELSRTRIVRRSCALLVFWTRVEVWRLPSRTVASFRCLRKSWTRDERLLDRGRLYGSARV
jgi:hypothetical protein